MQNVVTVVEIMEKKVTTLEKEVKILRIENEELKHEMEFLKDPPIFYQCVYQDHIRGNNKTINFDSEFYSRRNSWTMEGGMDLHTGLFTAPVAGTYSVTYGLYVHNEQGEHAELYIQKNQENIEESHHYSLFKSETSGDVYEQGGRHLVTYLEPGDTLDIYCVHCDQAYVNHILLCIELSQFDVE